LRGDTTPYDRLALTRAHILAFCRQRAGTHADLAGMEWLTLHKMQNILKAHL